jgi:hypothetical protein
LQPYYTTNKDTESLPDQLISPDPMNFSTQNQEKAGFRQAFPILVIAGLIGIYLANCFTPLRLTNDTIRYINIKEWIEAGKPANDPAGKDFLPYGYVWFLWLLSKLHIAKSLFISVIHLFYLLGSLLFIKKIFGDAVKFWHLLGLCMLNWATMKFVITPLSEMQFLFLSTGALYFFYEFERRKKPGYLVVVLVFSALAMLTRTIGFILFASFVLTLIIRYRQSIRNAVVSNKWLAIGVVVLLFVPFLFLDQLGITGYLQSHSYYFRTLWENPLFFFGNNLKFHLIDWSALFLNSPAPKINILGSPLFRDTLYFLAGVVTFVWILYLLLNKNRNTPLVVIVYTICYIALILNWPLFEPRLWVPLIPIFTALILQQARRTNTLSKFLLPTYLIVYTLIGITAIGYYTYTSFNNKALSVKQDAGIWKKEYETHFFGAPINDSATAVKEPIVRILKKYD